MKIVHISLSGPYTEGWSYHENLLPYWHKKLGNNVVLIARDTQYVQNKIEHCETGKKIQDNGIVLYRIKIKDKRINSWIRPKKNDLLQILIKENPDFIWIHGVLNHFVDIVTNYKKRKNHNVVIVADNHTDFYNYGTDFLRKINLFDLKNRLKKVDSYVSLYYGVTPGRVDFMSKELGIKREKIKLSLQGGNPDEIDYKSREIIRSSFRNKHHIPSNAFVYVTGGKLDNKKRIIELVDSFIKSNNDNIRLIIFGVISNECLEKFNQLLNKDKRIIFIGWLNSVETSNAFLSSDFGIFPGGHSVLWEKALACGLPCGFEAKKGFEHVFVGGSVKLKKHNNDIVFDYDNFPFSKVFDEIDKTAKSLRGTYLYDSIAESTINDYYLLKNNSSDF